MVLAALGQREAEESEGGGTCALAPDTLTRVRRQARGVAARAVMVGVLGAAAVCLGAGVLR